MYVRRLLTTSDATPRLWKVWIEAQPLSNGEMVLVGEMSLVTTEKKLKGFLPNIVHQLYGKQEGLIFFTRYEEIILKELR